MSDPIDARELRCPLPVIRLAQAALSAAPGTRITLWASDPAARFDVPAWCRMRGHELLSATPAAGYTSYLVQVKAKP